MSRATIYQVKNFPFAAEDVTEAGALARQDGSLDVAISTSNDLTLRKILDWLNNYVKSNLIDIKRGDVLNTSPVDDGEKFIWNGSSVEPFKVFFGEYAVVPETYVWSDHQEDGCMMVGPAYWRGCSSVSWPSASVREKIASKLESDGEGFYEAFLEIGNIKYTFVFNFEDDFTLDQVKKLFLDPKNPLDLDESDDGDYTTFMIFPVDLMGR
jgi:hypothetical protein